MWLCSACARTKKQAKRLAASQLLDQLSSTADSLDNSCKNHESSAAADGHCQQTALARSFHSSSSTFFLLQNHSVSVRYGPRQQENRPDSFPDPSA